MSTPDALHRGRSPFVDNAVGALLDADGRIVRWTPEAARLLGIDARQVHGRPARELLDDPAAWPAMSELTERQRAEGWSGEAVFRSGRGERLALSFQILPLDAPAASEAPESPESPDGSGAARYLVLAAPTPQIARWRQDQAFTSELFLQDRVGLAVFDERLRLVRTNTHLLPYSGLPPDLRGRRLGDFLQPRDAAAVERGLRDVLRTGRPLIAAEEVVRTIEDPAGGAVMAISAFRLQATDGQVIGVTALFTDVTELHRSGERLALLHRATAAVGGSLSVGGTAEELAAVLAPPAGDRTEPGSPDQGSAGPGTAGPSTAGPGAAPVPGLADLAVVDVAEAVFTGGEPVPGRDGRVLLRRAAVAVSAPPGEPAPGPGGPVAPPPPPPVGAAVHAHPDEQSVHTDFPASMAVPLRAGGRLLGRVSVHRAPNRPPYLPADLELLREIADRAALALDNARRYAREHRAAVGLQRSLLPPSQAETTAASTTSVYLPTDTASGIGGDWFDVIPLSSARVALVAGDVVGHGLAASATMGRLRTAVRTLADLDLEPDELLAHLDDLVAQLMVEAERPDEDEDEDRAADGAAYGEAYGEADGPGAASRPPVDHWWWPDGTGDGTDEQTVPFGATCVYAVYDPVSRRCAMASAGHPPPAVAAPDGRVTYVPLRPGPPLGVTGLPFEVTEVELEPGSLLALYTDGLLLGYADDLEAGMDALSHRLAAAASPPDGAVTPAGASLRQLGRDLVAGLPAHRLTDDVTLLLARTRAVPAADTAGWTLEADPAGVARVREAATEQLRRWGLEELEFTTELVLSELVTNAIRYAGGPVGVRLIRAERLTCEVSDPSATQPRMRRAHLTDEGGRGLYLVAQLTTRWGSRSTRQGKTIWAEQELPPG
ncbi:SpoIIE family protein phosphatase [Kitasatospora purpeofusca]|uniref:SpoIIE family protein phosphatase n=1 Tax=Kitasatospora purpeofusca TaxID=67352 RepID=UPI002A5A2A5F|nr:SpoIIE family protein phosphatase [Kitasatospora purpeofusca]MDY0815061.1 SpoIIE family protein phosphatase [Kitasatospora purpeofusca]